MSLPDTSRMDRLWQRADELREEWREAGKTPEEGLAELERARKAKSQEWANQGGTKQ